MKTNSQVKDMMKKYGFSQDDKGNFTDKNKVVNQDSDWIKQSFKKPTAKKGRPKKNKPQPKWTNVSSTSPLKKESKIFIANFTLFV